MFKIVKFGYVTFDHIWKSMDGPFVGTLLSLNMSFLKQMYAGFQF